MKAHFKTGYDQREIVVDVVNTNTSTDLTLTVGDVVALTADNTSGKQAIALASSIATGNYIVAQSDMTMDRRDYDVSNFEYSDKVVVEKNRKVKKIALFRINDVTDVIKA
jgi:hypothetical protein